MENNQELNQMKQEWQALQTALNDQVEINVNLVVKAAKKRISWNRSFLRLVSALTVVVTIPGFLFLFPYFYGAPQSICVALAVVFGAAAINMLHLSSIIQTPHNGKIDTLKYSRALVRFKRQYIWSEVVGTVVVIPLLIWAIMSMESNVPAGRIGGLIGGVIGGIVGISLSLKLLRNIKELQNDISKVNDITNGSPILEAEE